MIELIWRRCGSTTVGCASNDASCSQEDELCSQEDESCARIQVREKSCVLIMRREMMMLPCWVGRERGMRVHGRIQWWRHGGSCEKCNRILRQAWCSHARYVIFFKIYTLHVQLWCNSLLILSGERRLYNRTNENYILAVRNTMCRNNSSTERTVTRHISAPRRCTTSNMQNSRIHT